MVSREQLKHLQDIINKEFEEGNLPIRIEVRDFKQTPVNALEHSLMYFKTVSLGAHIRAWEIVGENFQRWLREFGLTT